MGVIITILACLVPGSIVFFTVRAMRRDRVTILWWTALSLLAIVGIVVGVWAGFVLEYHVTSNVRFAGFPFPMAMFQLENGVWVDYVHDRFIMLAIGASDVLVITLCSILPISATFYARRFLCRRKVSS